MTNDDNDDLKKLKQIIQKVTDLLNKPIDKNDDESVKEISKTKLKILKPK